MGGEWRTGVGRRVEDRSGKASGGQEWGGE